MDGMDLWNMFSSDFVEGDAAANVVSSIGIGDGADDAQVKQELPDFNEEDEEQQDDNGGGDEQSTKDYDRNEPDDNAIFNFELEPIVNIGESQQKPIPLQHQQQHLHQYNQYNNNRTPTGVPPATPKGYARPVTSQINATDENGIPINYEMGVIYICPACGSEYYAQDKWKAHMNQMHQYNTRRGLNFVRIDKLYHQCIECKKHIAMHSMENLLKHKFTHLPYRCTKCAICMRQYKYRQDLMVHLRMLHRDDVIALIKERGDNKNGPPPRGVGETASETNNYSGGRQLQQQQKETCGRLSIMNVKANAVDMFDADDSIEVKNELLDAEADDSMPMSTAYVLPAFLDDEVSRSSSQNSARRSTQQNNGGVGNGLQSKDEAFEDYIHYVCPQCGTECETYGQWNQHIEFVHDFVSRRGLGFRNVNQNQTECTECKKIVEPNNIKTLQLHKFSHLPHSDWQRCRLCYKGFKDRTQIQRHLLQQHHLDSVIATDETSQPADDLGDDGLLGDDQLLDISTPRNREERDAFEKHIDYLCPQCGTEFFEKKFWRAHIMTQHQMNDLATLNFRAINERQLMCNECDKVITNAYGIQNAQQHRITHMPYKAFARCRICRKSYTDRKGLVKHLATRHNINYKFSMSMSAGQEMKSSRDGFEERRPSLTMSAQQRSGPPPPAKQRRKQIVTVENEVFEIVYLDEDGDNDDTLQDETCLLGGGGDDYVVNSHMELAMRFKCHDCGSLFQTQSTLQKHIRDEHEFMDFNDSTSAPLPDERSNTPTTKATSLAAAPQRDEDESSTSVPVGIERHFIYMCPSCGKEYKTQFDWRRHINEVHNFDKRQYLNMRQIDKFRYQCTQCKDIVCNPKLKGLQDHHFRHLAHRLYLKCVICGTCYNHKPNIMSHLARRHNIIEPVDSDPPQQTAQQYSKLTTPTQPTQQSMPDPQPQRLIKARPLDTSIPVARPAGLNTLEDNISYHNAVDLDFITYFCPKCNKNFDSHAFWRKHIVEEHNYNSREGLNFRQIDNHHFLCLECYKRVTVTHTKGAIGQLQSHKFRHLPYRSFKCLTCNGEFVRKQMFFKHLNRETNRCDNKRRSAYLGDGAGGSAAASNDDYDAEFDDAETASNSNQRQSSSEQEQATADDEATNLDGCNAYDDDVDDEEGDTPGCNESSAVDAATFKLMCPQCGVSFESKSSWREHINIYHRLGKRKSLNVIKIGEAMYECRNCNVKLSTNKLRDLQMHCFRHLPYGAHICCQLCTDSGDSNFYNMPEFCEHLREHHPYAAPPLLSMQDLNNAPQLPQQPTVEEPDAELDEDEEQEQDDSNNQEIENCQQYLPIPPHMLDDNVDFDEQYLLG